MKRVKVSPTLLIDADIVTYAHARMGQRAYDFAGDGEPSVVLDEIEDVEEAAVAEIEALKTKFATDDVILCYTDTDGNFRKRVLPTYKAGRPPKPLHYYPLRDRLHARYRTYLKPHLEGDDIMGILATHPTLVRGPKVIVSIDKDMKQIPGKLYNPGKDTLVEVDAGSANEFFYTQVLTGDPTDVYKGCPGVGPKKAAKILADVPPMEAYWPAIVRAYEAKGLTEADALVQARCARILQHTDYDFKRKEVKLWNPPAPA
jgi:DNA polymerase-1